MTGLHKGLRAALQLSLLASIKQQETTTREPPLPVNKKLLSIITPPALVSKEMF